MLAACGFAFGLAWWKPKAQLGSRLLCGVGRAACGFAAGTRAGHQGQGGASVGAAWLRLPSLLIHVNIWMGVRRRSSRTIVRWTSK